MHATASTNRTPSVPWRTGLLLAALLGFSQLTAAQQSAARVMAVSGSATATDAQGRERALEKGAELFSGDKIVTAEGALVQMRTHDGGYLSVRPSTAMVIEHFVHDEKVASNSAFLLSLLRGGFRSITGLIGRSNPNGYQIRSSTATIGIRGTDHEPMLILDTPAMQTLGAPGLYDKVNDGETFIRNQNGVLSLKRGDVGFAPQTSETPPQVLMKIPDFYKLELKTEARDAKDPKDARDGKDGADGKPDANTAKRAPPANALRPTLAARKDALQAGDGKAPVPVTNPGANPLNNPAANPIASPAAGPTANPTPNPAVQPLANAVPEATAPMLTPEQKKAIIVQGVANPVQKPGLNTAPLLTNPIAPTGTVLPK